MWDRNAARLGKIGWKNKLPAKSNEYQFILGSRLMHRLCVHLREACIYLGGSYLAQ